MNPIRNRELKTIPLVGNRLSYKCKYGGDSNGKSFSVSKHLVWDHLNISSSSGTAPFSLRANTQLIQLLQQLKFAARNRCPQLRLIFLNHFYTPCFTCLLLIICTINILEEVYRPRIFYSIVCWKSYEKKQLFFFLLVGNSLKIIMLFMFKKKCSK